jgi:putative nucleotidyltransferase with HDIG domain
MHPDPSELLKTIVDLRPFPVVANRVMGLVSDERTSAQELAHVLSADTAMTARLLKLSNSAEAGYGHRVCTVREAVVVLGFKQVRQLAFVASVMSNFKLQRGVREWFDADRFWLHNIEVGIAAETVAKHHATTVTPDEAFTAGVLHDIGRLVLVQAFPREALSAQQLHVARGMSLRDAELRVIGYTHDAIGGALALQWNFPKEIFAAIREHHSRDLTLCDGLKGIIALCDRLAFEHDEPTDAIADDLLELDELCGGWPQVVERSEAFIHSIERGARAA